MHEDGIMGLLFSVSESSERHVTCPEERVCGDPCSSGTHLVVGRSASEEEAIGAAAGAPMEIPSSS